MDGGEGSTTARNEFREALRIHTILSRFAANIYAAQLTVIYMEIYPVTCQNTVIVIVIKKANA